MWPEQAIIQWSLLLLAAAVRSFAHMPLRISDRNKMVLWPGCEGRAEFSLHTKNVRSVWFVVKRRGCCCSLSGGVVLIVWFTTNGMCGKNNTIICVAWASNSKRDCKHDLYCCLLPRCETLRTCRSGFPIATVLAPDPVLWLVLMFGCKENVHVWYCYWSATNAAVNRKVATWSPAQAEMGATEHW